MVTLNLPSFEYSIKKADGKVWIFDVIRKKFIILTPEEWVRQHFIHHMINSLKYPKALVKIESGLTYNQLQKRSDIVVYNREGNPWMIVECKSPDQKLNQQTLQQVSVYNNTLRATYIAITNGLIHVCCKMNWDEKGSVLMDVFPEFD